ncbi:TPA: hypothetical protein HA235_03780 [Candidatus Woesearchaeota archaeon]|nr:hypothetical protein [uncultured archaeon]MBS3173296.1 hypothetical protein [Candidatus Woesearchaeota archaeon]HIH31802.1 hypothetical protein [Candidatus Woesearchaeota archaeon]HIH55483.1 hypothetical protein [Candidatus Woesearchaeota archaeon]HIJ01875.1 hypothetical protein [Candidatus Woesearchaeota archaeon]
MSYGFPRPILFKIEKIVGFLLFIIGLFAVLKLFGVLNENLLVPNQYMAWFTAIVCVIFGFILMSHKQHGIY